MPIVRGSNGKIVGSGASRSLGRVMTVGSLIKGSVKRGQVARTIRIDRSLLAGKASRPTGRLGAIQTANRFLLSRNRLAATVKAQRRNYRMSGFSVTGRTATLVDHGKTFTKKI